MSDIIDIKNFKKYSECWIGQIMINHILYGVEIYENEIKDEYVHHLTLVSGLDIEKISNKAKLLIKEYSHRFFRTNFEEIILTKPDIVINFKNKFDVSKCTLCFQCKFDNSDDLAIWEIEIEIKTSVIINCIRNQI